MEIKVHKGDREGSGGGSGDLPAAEDSATPADPKACVPSLPSRRSEPAAMQLPHEGIARSLYFVCEHGLEAVRVADLANAATMSKRGFHKAFARHTGESPGRTLRRLRLRRAQRMLLDSTWDLKEIARKSGYRSVNSLWVAFKRDVGMSPARFRRERKALVGEPVAEA